MRRFAFWKGIDSASRNTARRFLIKLVAIFLLAAAGAGTPYGFAKVFTTLLLLCALLSCVIALFHRYSLYAPVLNHWDEALVFFMLFYLARGVFLILC